jgi:hypothetical protein
MMQIIDLHCWLILFASAITAMSALFGLVADRYQETLAENIGLSGVALSGFVVVAQISEHGYTHISGVTMQSISVAWYAAALVLKHRKGYA